MAVKQTSLEAYKSIKADLGRLQKRIYDCIYYQGVVSRREIAEITKLPINVVTPRVNELIKLGLVEVFATAKDNKTGRKVEILRVRA